MVISVDIIIEVAYPEFDINQIKKVVVDEVTITAKQGRESSSRDIEVIMSKEGGEWKILYFE